MKVGIASVDEIFMEILFTFSGNFHELIKSSHFN